MNAGSGSERNPPQHLWQAVSGMLLALLLLCVFGGLKLHDYEITRLKKRHSVEMNTACSRLLLSIPKGPKYVSMHVLEPFIPYSRRIEYQPDGSLKYWWGESWVGGGSGTWITIKDSEIVDGYGEIGQY